MINKYEISKSNDYYRAFPDLILLENKMVCIFAEMNLETNENNICYSESFDRGITWTKTKLFAHKIDDNGRWDCPRLCKMKDKTIIVVSTWYLNDDKDKKNSYVYMWHCNSDFTSFGEPQKTTITGIVPDKILELDDKWIITTHERNEKLNPLIYYSYDKGNTWSEKQTLIKDERYNLCETSIVKVDDNILVAIMRENSDLGIDALKSISYDNGETWSNIYNMPIPACHRPIITKLKSDKYLITYRFNHGKFIGKGIHGHNLMGCICSKEDMKELNRDNIQCRIFPIDYDRNVFSNCGYTGVVQFEDGMIYVVSHIVDDNPVSQIRGYSFYEKDIIIEV